MFSKSIKLFTIFGFEVKLDLSWLILAVLITASLALGVFPFYFEDFAVSTYWWMGVAGTIGLFFSIVLHELFHSLVARQFGIPMHGITLFIFGGMAEMHDEPKSPKAEILMSAAGPAVSIVFGLALIGVYSLAGAGFAQTPTGGVIGYLGYINLILAVFNLLPAFPLDGGRIFRSILWKFGKPLKEATSIAAKVGSVFGVIVIILGVVDFALGNFIGGIWLFLIGMFIRNAAQMSYRQLLIRQTLEGEKTERFMKKDPITVSPSLSLEDLVDQYIYKYHHKLYPVMEDSRLVGCVSLPDVKQVDKDEWNQRSVRDISKKCSDENTVSADEDAVDTLKAMRRKGISRMIVTRGDKLVGVVTLKDMLEFLSLKLDLEEKT